MLLFAGVVQAQEKGHYLKFDLGGGLHKINYTLENGTLQPGFGLTGNMAYNYFFTPNWGVGSGLGIQTYKSIATLNYMSSTPAVDTDGDTYEYRLYYSDWQETQRMWMLDIPIALSYQHFFGEKVGMLISTGTKISLPIKSTYETTDGQIASRGYYPQWNVELADMPQHNFNTYSEFPGSDIPSKLNLSLFADFGMLYKIKSSMDLYLAAYVGYGLSDVANPSELDIYQEDGLYNGILASNQLTKANLFSVGLKVGINLHLSKEKAIINPNEETAANDTLYKEPLIAISDTAKETTEQIIVEEKVEKDTIYEEQIIVTADTLTEKSEQFELARKTASEINPHFAFDAFSPNNDQENKINELTKILKENSEIKLHIVGHTCNQGSKNVNIIVGLTRAEKMKEIFTKKGVPAEQISTESKYYSEPLVPNTSNKNRAKNRRVELKIIE